MLGEQRNTQRGDRESRTFQTIDKIAVDAKAHTESELQIATPEPRPSAARACCSGGRPG